jgi:actin-related protein
VIELGGVNIDRATTPQLAFPHVIPALRSAAKAREVSGLLPDGTPVFTAQRLKPLMVQETGAGIAFGGMSRTPGLADALARDNVQIVRSDLAQISSWIGGSIAASLGGALPVVTKAEYTEMGLDALARKRF